MGKILALAGIGTGALIVVDRVQNGNWIWERGTANLRLQQARIQQQQFQAQQMRAREAERARLAKEKSVTGRYASPGCQAGYSSPTVNYGLSHY